jgi:hypothetical protein
MDLKIPSVRFVPCKNTSGSVYLQDTNNPWENARTHTFHSDPNAHWNSNFLLPFSSSSSYSSSATAQLGPYTASLLRSLDLSLSHTHAHTHTHTVGLLWTSAQLVREAATYTTNSKHETNIHTFSGIRTRDCSNQAAPDPRLRLYGHRDQQAGLSIPFSLKRITSEIHLVQSIPWI